MTEPLWHELIPQHELEEQLKVLWGPGTNNPWDMSIHLARFAEARMYERARVVVERLAAQLAEARRRDAAAQRVWPTGDAAAEQLARVWQEMRNDERATYGFPRRAWETYSAESHAEFIATAAAVLARLAEGTGDEL